MVKRHKEKPACWFWAQKSFDILRCEIWALNENGERERASEFQRILNVLHRLPVLPERGDHIQAAAFEIATTAMFADLHDQPNTKPNPGGTGTDLDELQNLHDHLFKAADCLYQMHQGARAALEKHDRTGLRKFQRDVAKWSNIANQAWVELNSAPHYPSRKGRPSKETEMAIRSVALRSYERLTGRPATRKGPDYGPFVDFLKDLFGSLGLDPMGAASQGRQAIAEKRRSLENNSSKNGS